MYEHKETPLPPTPPPAPSFDSVLIHNSQPALGARLHGDKGGKESDDVAGGAAGGRVCWWRCARDDGDGTDSGGQLRLRAWLGTKQPGPVDGFVLGSSRQPSNDVIGLFKGERERREERATGSPTMN